MNVKIFVLQHAPGKLPDCFADKTIYRPIQCGSALHAPIEDALRDDLGENISALNIRYNEMTAIYWIAKHPAMTSGLDYIGFAHYRRFLNWTPEQLSPTTVVVRKWFSWRTLGNQYDNCHDPVDRACFAEAFKREFGHTYDDLDRYWKTHFFYICNLFVMSRETFSRYSEFIVRCIDLIRNLETAGKLKPHDDPYQNRAPSFLLEAMTSYWLWHESRAWRIRLVPSHITHFNIENACNGSATIDRSKFLWFLRQAY